MNDEQFYAMERLWNNDCKDDYPTAFNIGHKLIGAHRSTIEAYSKGEALSAEDQASACGLLLRKSDNWDAHFRVLSGGSQLNYKLDRWD